MTTATVTGKGRITLPAAVRAVLGVESGDRVESAAPLYPDRDELLKEFPELGAEDIRQAHEFAACNLDDPVLPLEAARSRYCSIGACRVRPIEGPKGVELAALLVRVREGAGAALARGAIATVTSDRRPHQEPADRSRTVSGTMTGRYEVAPCFVTALLCETGWGED